MLSPGCRTIAGMVRRVLEQAVSQAAIRISHATGVFTSAGLQDLIQKEFVSMGYRFQAAHGTLDHVESNLFWLLCRSLWIPSQLPFVFSLGFVRRDLQTRVNAGPSPSPQIPAKRNPLFVGTKRSSSAT